MFDLIIRNAKLVDGTGAPAREADIAIKDGLIAEVGTVGSLEGTATTEIDASGDLVTPGWVDIHPIMTVRSHGTRICCHRAGTA